MKMKKLVSLFVISFITISLFSQNKIPLIYVGSGIFQMGSNNGQNNEKPVHTVSLSSFYIGKTEVTQAQWKAVMKNNPSDSKGDNHPVENVSWYDAIAFCNKLSMIEGRTPVYSIDGITDPDKWNLSSNLNGIIAKYESANGYRLPTEAEWEYAARGGVKSKNYRFSGSDNSGSVAWYDANSSYQVHDVSTKSANELGICDMTGNVYEWCWDGYTSNYNNKSETNPTGPTYSTYKVARGGSFVDNFDYCRVSFRTAIQSSEKRNNLGFRVACSSEETIGYFRHQKDIEDQKLKLQEKKLQVWSFTDELKASSMLKAMATRQLTQMLKLNTNLHQLTSFQANWTQFLLQEEEPQMFLHLRMHSYASMLNQVFFCHSMISMKKLRIRWRIILLGLEAITVMSMQCHGR